jgi:hypothetical protein
VSGSAKSVGMSVMIKKSIKTIWIGRRMRGGYRSRMTRKDKIMLFRIFTTIMEAIFRLYCPRGEEQYESYLRLEDDILKWIKEEEGI